MGIKVRAHAPVWHSQTGAWMYKDGDKPASPELIYERIDAHSKALCEHFNDDVYAWDVVNEATLDNLPEGGGIDGNTVYRESDYYKLTRTGFIEAAFRAMDNFTEFDINILYFNKKAV